MRNVESNVVYGMYSGLALLMDVYHPARSNGHGVLYINGSGWHSPLAYAAAPLKETPLGIAYAEALQEAGYMVFALNHRQAPRFRYPAAVEDAQRAVRFVRHNAAGLGIHASRIGAAGGSSGGHLVCLLGSLHGRGEPDDQDPVNRESARVQCVVARAAPVDLVRMGTNPLVAGFMGTIFRGEAAGPYGVEQRTYREASPLTYVDGSTPPTLLIAGTADAVVPPEQTQLMHSALKAADVPVEVLWIEGAGHGPEFPGAVDPPDYLGAMVRWFDRHLARSVR
jgi:acetyl esterase/lipase